MAKRPLTLLSLTLLGVLILGSGLGVFALRLFMPQFTERPLTDTYVEVRDRRSATSSLKDTRTGATINPEGVRLTNIRLIEDRYILADIKPDENNFGGIFCLIRATGRYRYFRSNDEFTAFAATGGD